MSKSRQLAQQVNSSAPNTHRQQVFKIINNHTSPDVVPVVRHERNPTSSILEMSPPPHHEMTHKLLASKE